MSDFASGLKDLSLDVAFKRATQLLHGLEGGAELSKAQEAQRLLGHCEQLIDRAALFSANEDEDDLLTSHLKYLLVPFMHAELLSSCPTQDPRTRLQQLHSAHQYYCQYLQRCQQYGFVKGNMRDAYIAEEQGSVHDPGASRNLRIERFKRSKAIDQLLQQMKVKQKQADEQSGGASGLTGSWCGWDEEDERQLWDLQLEAAGIKALDSRPLLRQEMQLLQHVVKQQLEQHLPGQEGRQQEQLQHGGASSSNTANHIQNQPLQQQMMHKLAGIAGQLSLSSDRQVVRQQVFRPSHILPSLTVEQQGAIEVAQARDREARQREAEAAAAARKAEARSDDEDEAELAKARAWDDFKDDNPRGWGNSKLRPCA